ncbi:hypothetical protein GCM10011290_29900 [Vogesella alkaliphila]|uniref:Uncharacterized protein n=1 Tax=Vogesella alkaliphila TaxID=1193621 RepID=A0ABQ2Z163_9NEIS|nr:hypothetical protein GCM10011290_29900 [Vogesella alkaliphila]
MQPHTLNAHRAMLDGGFSYPLKIRSDSGDIAPPLIHKALKLIARSDISGRHYGDTANSQGTAAGRARGTPQWETPAGYPRAANGRD